MEGDCFPMKRCLLSIFLLSAMTLTGLAELPEWAFLTPRKEMQITEDGSRKVLPFVRAEQDVVILEPIAADGMKKSDWTGTADALRGICRLPGGAEFRMESSIQVRGPRKLEWSMRLSADRPQKVKQLWIGLTFNPAMKGRNLVFRMASNETVNVALPEPEEGFRWVFSTLHKRKCAEALVVPMRRGALKISGFRTPVQVARYGKNGSNVRLLCATGETPVQKLNWTLEVEYVPWKFQPLSLRESVNMGFADPVANDGRGGWTDQGPENDLAPMETSLRHFGEIPFDIVDPGKNHGKSSLVFRNSSRPAFLKSAEIPGGGVTADWLYLLHAAAWVQNGRTVGSIQVQYQDGSSQEIPVVDGRDVGNWWTPSGLENGMVAWRAENASAPVGLYLSRFAVRPKPIRSVRLVTEEKTLWMVVGMTAAKGKNIPFETDALREISCSIVPGRNWRPFRYSRQVLPGSALDFSGFEKHAPAGKFGRVIVKGEHFYFEKRPEMPVRFLGTNVAYWGAMFATEKEREELPLRLRAVGYNAVRFHHFDEYLVQNGSKLIFNQEKLDRWHKTFARYKELGFYVTLDLFTIRMRGFSRTNPIGDAFYNKALILFDPETRKEMKEFARQLLGTVNPYTGMTVAEDPALLSVGLINEDKMFTSHEFLQYGTKDPQLSAVFRQGFSRWCRENGLPENSRPADSTWAQYVSAVHLDLYRDFKDLFRELKCQAPVSDISAGREYILAPIRNRFDYTDLHTYHDHPVFPGPKWKHPMEFRDVSAISDFASSPLDAISCRIFGKPFMITEWHFCAPNSWRSESGAVMGALSAFQGVDGIFDFWGMPDSDSGNTDPEPGTRGMGTFDTLNDPISLFSSRILNFFFLRRDVKEAGKTMALQIPETIWKRPYARSYKIWKESRNAVPPEALQRLGLFCRIGIRISDATGEADSFPADSAARLADAARKDPDLFLKKAGFPTSGIRTSCTGELSFQPENNLFRVVTPKSEALIQQGKTNRGAALRLEENSTFSTVFAGSLDNRNLTESCRILLLHLTDVKPSNGRFTRYGTRLRVHAKGSYPYLLRTGSVRVGLKNSAKGRIRLFALDSSGKRREEIPFAEQNGHISFVLRNDRGEFAPLAYELIRE